MNRIKELRESLGITQDVFSKRLGLARNTIANYECGRRDPTNQVITAICKEYNINEEWFRTGNGEMKKDMSVEEEIYGRFGKIMEKSSPVKKEIASMLIQIVDILPDEEWEYIYGEFKKCIQRIEEAKREED